jgi:hypothetical protein
MDLGGVTLKTFSFPCVERLLVVIIPQAAFGYIAEAIHCLHWQIVRDYLPQCVQLDFTALTGKMIVE